MRILEICVDSLKSAKAAIDGGADRLELCSALVVGGLTPYEELLKSIRSISDIPIRCLMRPRGGDFLYEESEIDMMVSQIKSLKASGADGFVIGCLNKDGYLDMKNTQKLVDAAEGASLTLHRCIDVSADIEKTYIDAKSLGIDTVLTSGGESSCKKGMDIIGRLLELREEINGPEILIGAGVNGEVIKEFLTKYPKANAFHMSGKTEIESGMIYRKKGVPMGLPGLDEWHLQVTDEEAVSAAKKILKECC